MTSEETLNILSHLKGITPLRICGEGAFGSVWLAEDTVGRKLAVKVVDKALLGNAWKREFNGIQNYCRRIGVHPHLVPILHITDEESCFVYTMEAADNFSGDVGGYQPDTLEARLDKYGRLKKDEFISITWQLLSGLKKIHSSGLVHRDIKPGNILFCGGVAKIGDLGLVASSAETMSIAGTPGFLPPELLKYGTTGVHDCAQDLYSLGKVLYCMLSGYSPDVFPSLPPELYHDSSLRALNEFISQACSPDHTQRFQTVESFERAFSKAVSSLKFPGFWRYAFLFSLFLVGAGIVYFVIFSNSIFQTTVEKSKEHGYIWRKNIPLPSIPSARLIFFDPMENSPSSAWRIHPEPRDLFSMDPDGIRMLTVPGNYDDPWRELFLELPQIPLNSNFEIIFTSEGNIHQNLLRFYLYPASIFPEGILLDNWEHSTYLLLENSVSPGGVVFRRATWGNTLLKVGMNSEISNQNRIFLREHRILRENNKLSYYSNGHCIVELSLEDIMKKEMDSFRFALNLATGNPGSFVIRNFAVYSERE